MMAAFEEAEVAAEVLVIRNEAGHEIPEARGVVEFGEMTEFVNDYVVGDVGREK